MDTTDTKYGEKFQTNFTKNLQNILNTVAAEEIKDLYLSVYDKLANIEEAEAGSAIKGKDPMSLKSLRSVFETQLQGELANAKVVDGQWEVSLMNKDLLGYAGTTPTGPVNTVDVLAFYLEGVPDEHAFITTQQYAAGRKGSSRGSSAGRLGGGFMMSRRDYEREGWAKITGLSFAEVRHPISSQKRFDGFDNLAEKIDLNKYIKLALAQTNQTLDS